MRVNNALILWSATVRDWPPGPVFSQSWNVFCVFCYNLIIIFVAVGPHSDLAFLWATLLYL